MFDAAAYMESFWTGPLLESARHAVDAAELLAAFRQDPADAATRYGHRLGLSGNASFFVSGTGRIVAVDEDAVSIALQEGDPAAVVIETGPVFGNAIRDGSGLLDVSDFSNAQDFNAISSEINRRVEEQVFPVLEAQAAVGADRAFCRRRGCGRLGRRAVFAEPGAGGHRISMTTGADISPGDIVLEAQGISKSFPGVKALDDVSITLRSGRLTALLGENGAGKSTLMNIIAGVFSPDEGEVRLAGEAVRFSNPREAREAGISMIFQELNLVPNLTVAENIFLGREPMNRLWIHRHREDEPGRRQTLLEQLDLEVAPTTPLGHLRVGQQQTRGNCQGDFERCPGADHGRADLGHHRARDRRPFRHHRELKQQGVAIAYITHKLEELTRIGDDAVVMRDGKLIGAAPLKDLNRDEIVRMMVGREMKPRADRSSCYPGGRGAAGGRPLARAPGSSRRFPAARYRSDRVTAAKSWAFSA